MPTKPSTRFPFISLAKALERAEALFNDDKRGNGMKMPTAFAAWGYSDKSSGGFQTVSALKGYGLLGDDGAKEDRGVRLTDTARRYFMTEIEEEHEAMRTEFALQPALMRHLYERWDGHPPSDPVARSYLKTEIGLNDQSARAALGIYKANLSYISSKGSDKPSDEPEDFTAAEASAGEASMQHATIQQPIAGSPVIPISAGPGLNLVRTTSGYVIHLNGAVMTQKHADEVIALITALKSALPADTLPEMPN